MGGMIRCIRNDYNLDKLENEINRTDSVLDLEEMYESIKQKNNIYIDTDTESSENNHYAENTLIKERKKHSRSMYIPTTITTKI